MALRAGPHTSTTPRIPLTKTSCFPGRHCRMNADSAVNSPTLWSCSMTVRCVHHGAMKPVVSAAEPTKRVCVVQESIQSEACFTSRVLENPSSAFCGNARITNFASGSRSGVKGKRFDAMRACAKARVQSQPRTDDEQQRPPPEPIGKLEPSIQRYLQFLADYKIVYHTMEELVRQASHPSYAIFWNSGLERSAALAKDFEWFRSQGHTIPEPNKLGRTYAQRLKYLSENDPPAFIYSVYNVFYAHSAGGRYIGRKVADLILDGRELNFYRFDTEVLDLIDAARDKLDKLKATWPKETRDRMLKETRVSYKWSADLVRKYIRVYDNELPEIHEDVSLP